jgi:hypothetical protein
LVVVFYKDVAPTALQLLDSPAMPVYKTPEVEMNMHVIIRTNLPAIVWLKPGWE